MTETDESEKSELKHPPEGGRGQLDWQSWILIGLGILFVGGGALVDYFGMSSFEQRRVVNFVMCVGLAITLGEIGTRATLRWRGLVITGAGAVAIAFYILITPTALCELGFHCPPTPPPLVRYLLSGWVKIPESELDPNKLVIKESPSERDVRQARGPGWLYWTAPIGVELDQNGNPTKPDKVLLSYPGYYSKDQFIPQRSRMRSSDCVQMASGNLNCHLSAVLPEVTLSAERGTGEN